jgi:hypothetical protein
MFAWSHRLPCKAKGRFPLRGTALPIRFFGALVRLPNHSLCYPILIRILRTCARPPLTFPA